MSLWWQVTIFFIRRCVPGAVGGGAVDANRLSELIRKASDGVEAEPDGC